MKIYKCGNVADPTFSNSFCIATDLSSHSPSSKKDKDGKKSKLRNPLRNDARVQSYAAGDKAYDPVKLSDIKRMKSTHMERKLSQSHNATRRSILVESRKISVPTAPLPLSQIPGSPESPSSAKELPPPPFPRPTEHNEDDDERPDAQTL